MGNNDTLLSYFAFALAVVWKKMFIHSVDEDQDFKSRVSVFGFSKE